MPRQPETRVPHPFAVRRVLGAAASLVAALAVAPPGFAQSVGLGSLGATYSQNFDTLASSGTSSVTPTGWYFSETGTNADATYNTGTGSNNAGNTYSFGNAGSGERAFGALLSGTLTPTLGAWFLNNTGATITSLSIAYTGEQWRAGVANRNAADRLDFQLSTNATQLLDGTWTDYDDLDFFSPNINATLGAQNGNDPANRSLVSFTISGLDLADGATFWIRWADFNIASSDDGLAIDDFSVTPFGRPGTPAPEPGTAALLVLAAAALAASRRRRSV